MNCEKIIEIYNNTCNKKYFISSYFGWVTTNKVIAAEQLNLDTDRNCLQSMILLNDYCRSDYYKKNKDKE